MCTNPNNTATNPDNFNEKESVYKEIFTWAQHINNSIWLITSFFIGLNLVVIKTVLSNSENSHVKDFLEQLTCGQQILLAITIFVALWLIPAYTALTMMVISGNLYSFVKSTGPFTLEKLCEELKFTGPRKVFSIIRTPFGFIIASFTVLFGLAWLWIFPYII